ncbi:2-C-methyl-D-erythritol 4-phosphate cytidylyltransferase [Corynebacterium yudongzhengii]|uniref:2-C-methyl-D-erythritol 4-phosphate cytidylyltransferase n=1 Tax=Corynebacterium yudongzhengii TaxID=2080740 RepID=A0A2U1T5W3_9CORY|nr:2-C-methyl-D-erythritol 4-phosphate cytidylyltransferase [Corynebacterium yudongzhengii]AWB82626.1 2-C-methyl-D-erythritol 4-phosphate cytidylyltransferase [Corynebacterium yudongzhengii]PWC01410.1 2-C-methyl-D-erythritol 4-phosphate cytidylyltransferase [Corynebacterium yudongzhengii]
MRVVAVVAAAGQGTRLGADVPKAFVRLKGMSLVGRSVDSLRASGVVDEIIVLVGEGMERYCRDIPDVRLVRGGGERAESVWAGLSAIDDEDAIVLVHDAARALTPPGMIARVVAATTAGADAVVPVVPVTDTIKEVAGTRVVATPERASLRAVQTPQAFRLAALWEANRRYFAEDDPGFSATDDASLMEWCGHEVLTVAGDPLAFKITTPIDLRLAESVLDYAAQGE